MSSEQDQRVADKAARLSARLAAMQDWNVPPASVGTKPASKAAPAPKGKGK